MSMQFGVRKVDATNSSIKAIRTKSFRPVFFFYIKYSVVLLLKNKYYVNHRANICQPVAYVGHFYLLTHLVLRTTL